MMDFLLTKPFFAALIMGLCCPLVGRHLVLGRSVLLGLALPQVSLTGVALVFFGAASGWGWCTAFTDDTTRAFFGAALLTLPVLFLLATRPRLSETTLAFVYLAAISIANLLLCGNAVGETYTQDLFHGRLLLISDANLAVLAATLGVCTAASLLARRRIQLTLLDPDFARASGIDTRRWNRVTALLNGAVICVAVAATGPLVTFGFLILPVLCAAALARSLRAHLALALAFGAGMAVAGCALAYQYDLPLGDCVVATGCVALLLVYAVRGCGFFK